MYLTNYISLSRLSRIDIAQLIMMTIVLNCIICLNAFMIVLGPLYAFMARQIFYSAFICNDYFKMDRAINYLSIT